MKRGATGRDGNESVQRQRSVKWDEANLEENTKVQKEVNPVKINEPKTPYHGPLSSDDEEEELGEALSPLSLEDEASMDHMSNDRMSRDSNDDRSERRNGGHSDSDRGYQSSGARSDSWGSSYRTADLPSGDELDEDSLSSGGKKDRHRKFVARRKQHYNMREALKRGKELVEHEHEPSAQNFENANGH